MNTMSASQIKADFGVNVGDMIGNVIMIRLSPDVRLTIIHSIANPDQFLVLKDVTVDNPNVALESMEPMDLKIFRVDEEGNDIAIQVEVIIDALSDPYGVGDDSHTEYQVDVVSAVDPEGNSVILTNEENVSIRARP